MILNRKITFWTGIDKAAKLMFFGSGRVALPSLKILHKNYQNLSVVTQSTVGQKKINNQVAIFCKQKHIDWSSPVSSRVDKEARKNEWKEYVTGLEEVDFGVVCSYGYMLPTKLIRKFKKGLIVVHPSLLPKYRGGAPIFHAIANGQATSGVSYIDISEKKFDQGNILYQLSFPISQTAQYREIQGYMAQQAAKGLPYVLDNLDELRPGTSQADLAKDCPAILTLAPLVKSHKLDLNRPAEMVYHWSRAIQTPKVKLIARDCEMIVKFSPEYREGDGALGTFLVQGKRLFVRCADKYIRIKSWYEPKQSQQTPGIFIHEIIKSGRYPPQTVKFQ